jgi:hypothetical protein
MKGAIRQEQAPTVNEWRTGCWAKTYLSSVFILFMALLLVILGGSGVCLLCFCGQPFCLLIASVGLLGGGVIIHKCIRSWIKTKREWH